MKLKLITLVFLGLISSLSATTVTAIGGTAGALFYTSNDTLLTGGVSGNSTINAGLWDGTTFTVFAAADASPIGISANAALLGRWAGGYTDNNNVTASPFNGEAIWFRVTTTADGGGVAYFSSGALFPNANSGISDSISINSTALTTLGTGSSDNSRAFDSGDGRIIIGVVPEPSTALLGAFGALALLRRRRN